MESEAGKYKSGEKSTELEGRGFRDRGPIERSQVGAEGGGGDSAGGTCALRRAGRQQGEVCGDREP